MQGGQPENTGRAGLSFWSPDSQSIGFFIGDKVMRAEYLAAIAGIAGKFDLWTMDLASGMMTRTDTRRQPGWDEPPVLVAGLKARRGFT